MLGRLVRCPTPELVAFNARIWKDRKDQGLDINEPLEGVVIPESLKLFEADLVRMSSGGGVVWQRFPTSHVHLDQSKFPANWIET